MDIGVTNAPEMASSRTTVSGFRRRVYRAEASRMPWLQAAAKPRFSVFAIRVTSGNSARTMSAEPSWLLLSMTNTWKETCCVCSKTERRQPRRMSRVFQLTMTTATSVSLTRDAGKVRSWHRSLKGSLPRWRIDRRSTVSAAPYHSPLTRFPVETNISRLNKCPDSPDKVRRCLRIEPFLVARYFQLIQLGRELLFVESDFDAALFGKPLCSR